MRIKKILILAIVILCTANWTYSQDKPYKLLKFGVKGFGGFTDTTYLNTLTTNWLNMVVEASGAELMYETIVIPINVEYGFQPFLIIRPIRQIQIGIKMDYALSNLTSQFQNPLIDDQTYRLSINTKSYIPGIFAYLTLGKFELGGGLLQSYTFIDLSDDFFGYQDTWYGSNTGYELSLGFSTSRERHVGFTMSLRYRDLLIGSFTDNLNRDISYSNRSEQMPVNMSGLIIDMGIYFQFVGLRKHRNEN